MKDLLVNVGLKQRAEITSIQQKALIPRDCLTKLQSQMEMPVAKVVIGPRRAGKSSLVLQTLKESNFAYFNFEDEELPLQVSPTDLLKSLEEVYPNHKIIFFDEIQQLHGWEKFVNRLDRLGKNVVITGSNSKLLSSELASVMTGRCLEHQLLPFSFSEFCRAKDLPQNAVSFEQYLTVGGFPAVVLQNVPSTDYLNSLWDAVILKDIVQRYKVRRVAELKSLFFLIVTSMSARLSSRSLERALHRNLSHSTIQKYLDWGENAYIAVPLECYSFKPRVRVSSEKKLYLFDNGFFSAQKFDGSKDLGRLLENFIFVELCRWGFQPNLNLFYYRTKSGHEVDFLLNTKSGKRILIQVAYSLSRLATTDREIRALSSAANEIDTSNLYLVTYDDAERTIELDRGVIRVIPAWSKRLTELLEDSD